MAATTAAPVTGIFDDIGCATHALFRLQAAGFSPAAVHLETEDVLVMPPGPPAPPSLSPRYTAGGAVLGAVLLGLLAAVLAPPTIVVAGFNWHVSSVLLLGLTGLVGGCLFGAILGLGRMQTESAPPAPVPLHLHPAIYTVSVEAPDRAGEAEAILRSAGAREITRE